MKQEFLFPVKQFANPKDIVYTPEDVAKDIVSFYKPSGKVLDPCKGEGVFLKYLPHHLKGLK